MTVVGPPPVIRIVNPDPELTNEYPQRRPFTALDRIFSMLTNGFYPIDEDEEETQRNRLRMRKPQHVLASEPGEVSPTIYHFRVSRR